MLLSVFSQGDKGTSWYIIWKGSVNVVTHGKVSSPSSPPQSPGVSMISASCPHGHSFLTVPRLLILCVSESVP